MPGEKLRLKVPMSQRKRLKKSNNNSRNIPAENTNSKADVVNLRRLFGLHEKVEAARESNKRLIEQSEEEIKERKDLDGRLAAISNELKVMSARRQGRPRAQS